MARPRYTASFTLRLAPAMRADLETEAKAEGVDVADLLRDIVLEHIAHRTARGHVEDRATA